MAEEKRPEPASEPVLPERDTASVSASGSEVAAGDSSVAISGNVYGNVTVGASSSPELADGLRRAYLSWLIDQTRAVPLAGLDPKSIPLNL